MYLTYPIYVFISHFIPQKTDDQYGEKLTAHMKSGNIQDAKKVRLVKSGVRASIDFMIITLVDIVLNLISM